MPPRQFFNTVRQVLQEYGVTIREQDDVPAFLATQEIEPAKPLACPGTVRRLCRRSSQPANGPSPPV